MKILGLSYDFHDAAAALVVDGRTVAAIQEERLSRRKHDPGFPRRATKTCLEIGGLSLQDVDRIVYYEDPLLKFERILYGIARSAFREGIASAKRDLEATLLDWFGQGKFSAQGRIAHELAVPPEKVDHVGHHQAHAAAAFFCSPFERATVVTLDGVGEIETASVSLGAGDKIRRLGAVRYPHSIGLLYSAATAFLGFEVNEGEYKVMGMAGFGTPVHKDKAARLVEWKDGRFRVMQEYFNFFAPKGMPFTDRFVDLFGEPRAPDSPFDVGDPSQTAEPGSLQKRSRHYADIAASLQWLTEEIILDFVRAAIARTGVRQVCMAGGVALNALANGRIQRELDCELYVHPAAGDAGGALGAALYYHTCVARLGRPEPLPHADLGRRYDDAAIEAALQDAGVRSFRRFSDEADFIDEIVHRLAADKVVGWFQGRSEWGPRALGQRSILGNPAQPDMQRRINEKIKFREPFRPFAPAVLAERATEFFEINGLRSVYQPESFMLSVAPVLNSARARIPSAVHVDGTSRLQLVWETPRSPFRLLLEAFDRATGLPVLINTSFNRRGEPIVETPADALNTFLFSGLDCLAIGRCLVDKEQGAR